MRKLKIGIVVHRTGRLAGLGRPLGFAAEAFGARTPELVTQAGLRGLEVRLADSGSTASGARAAAEWLARGERVELVLTLGGTSTLPAVVETCRAAAVPCVSTTLPWQAYRAALPVGEAVGPPSAFHFCWGLDDIAHVFADAWSVVRPAARVGCLWNSGVHGQLLRRPENGFLAAVASRGFTAVDLGGYSEGAGEVASQAARAREQAVDVVTASALPGDLAAFDRETAAQAIPLRLITCSRWLSYPFGARSAAVEGVVTPVYWSPAHPWATADGLTAGQLAASFSRATGAPWCQPLGPAYALFEVAAHAFGAANDPHDRASVAAAVDGARVETVAGPLDWGTGPEPSVALLGLATGQWRDVSSRAGLVITATRTPGVPVTGDLRLRSRRGSVGWAARSRQR